MNTISRDKKKIAIIESISQRLEVGKDLIEGSSIVDFQNKAKNIYENYESIIESQRVLRIGIVGEVKAGKSSFLNALLFEGKSLLPKAATPMTAALTKIAYSEENYAKVVFYNRDEWKNIEKSSREYDDFINKVLAEEIKKYNERKQKEKKLIKEPTFESVERLYKSRISDKVVSCKELTKMVEESGIDKYLYLDKEEKIDLQEQSMEILQKYIGASGSLTPLVSYTEIYMDNPILEDFEIIDTPGLNDPIVSRSVKTKDFLMKCDVVFLLSYVGQFLSSEDIGFISSTLPSEGVQKAVIIGSKFDSGILDYKERNTSIKKALVNSRNSFDEQARENIEIFTSRPNCSKVIRDLEESLPPKYVSALMYSAGRKIENKEKISAEEDNIIKQMEKRFLGFSSKPEFLIDFSNIINIKNDIIPDLRCKKDEIIANKIRDFINNQEGELLNNLEDINIIVKYNLESLKNEDLGVLLRKKDIIMEKLDSIRSEVKNIFELSGIEAKKILRELANDVEKEANNYLDISISSRVENHRETFRTGFLGLKKDVFIISQTVNSADISEVIRNLRNYVTSSKEIVNIELERLFDTVTIKKQIKDTVIGAFDLTDKAFNENDILMPLESSLKQLSLPSFDIDLENYSQMVEKQFYSERVEGNEISKLALYQEKVVQLMIKEMTSSIINMGEKIDSTLNVQSGIFVDNIVKKLDTNILLLEKQLENKEENIKKYETFINNISTFKMEILEFKE